MRNAGVNSAARRYRIESEIAHGGVGAVYRVFDSVRGKPVALKRLLTGTERDDKLVALFEREYYTLTQLQHPRIIEVYDYGVDEVGPFYTMELLDGADLRAIAPIPYRAACSYLRDVASSLALLHARRWLHRDVSPRNIRLTGDQRAKLIDFGAMVSFGACDHVIGTPPCVPPEALHGAVLDQRSDLYALGACAYWALTGRHAYPARDLAALFDVWKTTPVPPSSLVRDVPAELEALVLSLLEQDPLARPSSAAEVIERLTAIAELSPENEQQTADGYLLSSPLVGRKREIRFLESGLQELETGRGGALLIEGAAGTGKTRLATELLVLAQLRGLLMVRLECVENAGPYSVIRALVEALYKTLPAHAEQALGELSGEHARLLRELISIPRKNKTPHAHLVGDYRARLTSALENWLNALAAVRPLLLIAEDIHASDEASLAFLAGLSRLTKYRPILLVTSVSQREPCAAPYALRALREASSKLELRGLEREETHELVCKWFGQVPDAERLSSWMFERSQGSPLECIEFARHLIARGVIRYGHGTWVLPKQLSTTELPKRFEETVQFRVDALPVESRRLAESLSVCRGALPLELCLALGEDGTDKALRALAQLVTEGVLVSTGRSYRFAQSSVREALLERVDRERRRRLHRQVGQALLGASAPHEVLEAGWHLLQGGQELHGADLLARVSQRLIYDAAHDVVPALEAALEVYRKHGRPIDQQLRMSSQLVTAAYYIDRTLIDRYGQSTLTALLELTGMNVAGGLRRVMGTKAGLYVGLATAVADRKLRPNSGKPSVEDSFRMLLACAASWAGVAALCLDGARLDTLVRDLEPLAGLPEEHAGRFLYDYIRMIRGVVRGENVSSYELALRNLQRLEEQASLPMSNEDRLALKAGVLNVLGILETFRDSDRALSRVAPLRGSGNRLFEMIADQVAVLHHAMRGQLELMRHHQERLETHAIQLGSAWQVEMTLLATLARSSLLTGDVVAMKRVAEQLDRLCVDIPTLEIFARLARAGYLYLQGSYREAADAYETAYAEGNAREYAFWAWGYGDWAAALNKLGEHQRAKALCSEALASLPPGEREFPLTMLRAEIELALAQAKLGEPERAAMALDMMIARYEGVVGSALLGTLHAARAQVALVARDTLVYVRHRALMERHFRETGNPALIARCARAAAMAEVTYSAPEPRYEMHELGQMLEHISSQARSSADRAQRLLELAVELSGATAGFLCLQRGQALECVAKTALEELPTAIWETVKQSVSHYVAPSASTQAIETLSSNETLTVEMSQYQVFVLPAFRSGSVVGALALRVVDRPLTALTWDVLRLLAAQLSQGSLVEPAPLLAPS